ncbi:MAG: CPBP family intramembrane glutamic endopeptidase, partial [Candidatus Cloacimonadales bacterium]
LTNYIYPIPESYLEAMENLVKMSDFSLWKSLLIIALLPGICEEILFRGFLINGFTKRGFWSAVIISAILFAIIHLDPFRFLPVTVLGIWLGYLALKTNSLFVPILAHTANNAIAVLLSRGHLTFLEKYLIDGNIPFWTAVPAIIIVWALYRWSEKINSNEI